MSSLKRRKTIKCHNTICNCWSLLFMAFFNQFLFFEMQSFDTNGKENIEKEQYCNKRKQYCNKSTTDVGICTFVVFWCTKLSFLYTLSHKYHVFTPVGKLILISIDSPLCSTLIEVLPITVNVFPPACFNVWVSSFKCSFLMLISFICFGAATVTWAPYSYT